MYKFLWYLFFMFWLTLFPFQLKIKSIKFLFLYSEYTERSRGRQKVWWEYTKIYIFRAFQAKTSNFLYGIARGKKERRKRDKNRFLMPRDPENWSESTSKSSIKLICKLFMSWKKADDGYENEKLARWEKKICKFFKLFL